MGKLVRTIVLEVPCSVVYSAIKEFHLSPLEEEWRHGLPSWAMSASSLSKDLPNSELVFTGGGMGSRLEETYVLRSLQEKVTEVTYQMKYSLVFGAELAVVHVRDALRMLEYGYKSKNA